MLLAAAVGPRNEAVPDDFVQNPQQAVAPAEHDQQNQQQPAPLGRADLLRLLHANSAAAVLVS